MPFTVFFFGINSSHVFCVCWKQSGCKAHLFSKSSHRTREINQIGRFHFVDSKKTCPNFVFRCTAVGEACRYISGCTGWCAWRWALKSFWWQRAFLPLYNFLQWVPITKQSPFPTCRFRFGRPVISNAYVCIDVVNLPDEFLLQPYQVSCNLSWRHRQVSLVCRTWVNFFSSFIMKLN